MIGWLTINISLCPDNSSWEYSFARRRAGKLRAPKDVSELKGTSRLFVRTVVAAHGWKLGARRPLRHHQPLRTQSS